MVIPVMYGITGFFYAQKRLPLHRGSLFVPVARLQATGLPFLPLGKGGPGPLPCVKEETDVNLLF